MLLACTAKNSASRRICAGPPKTLSLVNALSGFDIHSGIALTKCHMILVGQSTSNEAQGVVLETQNAGGTISILARPREATDLRGISVDSRGIHWIVGISNSGDAYAAFSSDRGKSWTRIALVGGVTELDALAANGQRVLAVGEAGHKAVVMAIAASGPGKVTSSISPKSANEFARLNKIVVFSAGFVAVGSDGTKSRILRLDANGKILTDFRGPLTAATGVVFRKQKGFVSGYDGTTDFSRRGNALRSEDGGKHWSRLPSPGNVGLSDVFASDSTVFFSAATGSSDGDIVLTFASRRWSMVRPPKLLSPPVLLSFVAGPGSLYIVGSSGLYGLAVR